MNDKLKDNLTKIIKKEIIEQAREEAMNLLSLATKEEIGEFLYYYHSESVVAPAVIDSIKDRLVMENVLQYKKGDNFGLISNPEFNKE